MLTPAEYGHLSVALSIFGLSVVVFSFGLDLGVFRTAFSLAGQPEEQRRFVSSVWRFLMVVPLGLAVICSAAVAPLVSNDLLSPTEVVLTFVGSAAFVSATIVPLAVLRAAERLRDFLVISVGSAVLSTALIVLFVVALDQGVAGWLGGTLIANVATLALASMVMPFPRGEQLDRRRLDAAVRFSLPMLGHFVAMWGLVLANRLVLAAIVTPAKLGIYSLAANLALPVMIIVGSVNQGFMPTYARVGEGDAPPDSLHGTILLQVALVGALSLGAALLGPPVVNLVMDPDFAEAASVVPWMVLGFGLLGLYMVPMNIVTLVIGRTKRVWVISVAAVAANLTATAVLVPTFGIVAAGVATAIGFGILLAGILAVAVSRAPVRLPWGRLSVVLIATTACYALGAAVAPDDSLTGLALRAGWSVAAAAALLGFARQFGRGPV